MRHKFFCPYCGLHVTRSRRRCPSCHADIRRQLLVHDAAVVIARKVIEVFSDLLMEMEIRDAFDESYAIARAGLEAFIQKDGEDFRERFSPN
jgi:hypothetical protein